MEKLSRIEKCAKFCAFRVDKLSRMDAIGKFSVDKLSRMDPTSKFRVDKLSRMNQAGKFCVNFANGRYFLFNITEDIYFKKKSQLLFSLLNTYIYYIKTNAGKCPHK